MEKKLVLITGAAKRIGKAVALSMAENGWDVAIHYNNSQGDAEDTLKQIKLLGANGHIFKADLTNLQQTHALLDEINKKLGVVTCLINNASVFMNDTIEDFTAESWNENMAVNLHAPAILIKGFVNQLPASHNGNIINMLDYAVWRYPEKFMSYTTSKAGLWTLTQQLAYSLAPRNIRINAIGPGNTLPNESESEERFQKARASSPLGTGADPEEICNAVQFILKASSMTGQMLALDGGKHLVGPEIY